ncbi:type II toxin-antitoxin system PemK/MazF family toxin [Marinitoga sp. 1155]|uniref:type II toxin-antitoxin system PemK/MazF family toxin n=1 Tax=Marinitoga sp. 1155 TaxID=1428448 RepID=UPI000640DCC8|nr:type II toxin-antitoxin system PemK/MazF family toxin [Marinitoga sp. 1155]AMS33999.1 hypothetical protein UF09_57 [Marinitoga camini virus 2]KLO24785.1 hypothetical protein X274_02180 [Marinitoga sp. 1155]
MSNSPKARFGEIWSVEFIYPNDPKYKQKVQKIYKITPITKLVLIISDHTIQRPTYIGVLLTSQSNINSGIKLSKGTANLHKLSFVQPYQIYTFPKKQLKNKIGELPSSYMLDVYENVLKEINFTWYLDNIDT